MKHHQAITLSALGGRSELPQLVGLRCLGHLGVSKGTRGASHLYHHFAYTYRVRGERPFEIIVFLCLVYCNYLTPTRIRVILVQKRKEIIHENADKIGDKTVFNVQSNSPLSEGEGGSLSSKSSAEDMVPVEGVLGNLRLKSPEQ